MAADQFSLEHFSFLLQRHLNNCKRCEDEMLELERAFLRREATNYQANSAFDRYNISRAMLGEFLVNNAQNIAQLALKSNSKNL